MVANLIYDMSSVEEWLATRFIIDGMKDISIRLDEYNLKDVREESTDWLRERFRSAQLSVVITETGDWLSTVRFGMSDCDNNYVEVQHVGIEVFNDHKHYDRNYSLKENTTYPLKIFYQSNRVLSGIDVPASIRAIECVKKFNDLTYPIIDERYHTIYKMLCDYRKIPESKDPGKFGFLFDIIDPSDLIEELENRFTVHKYHVWHEDD